MKVSSFDKSSYQAISIIPDTGDEITALWGVKIVKNLMNGYGIFGTLRLSGDQTTWINFQLTRIYSFPPSINILYAIEGLESGAVLKSAVNPVPVNFIVPSRDGPVTVTSYSKRVSYQLNGNLVGFISNLQKNGELFYSKYAFIDAYFRITGV